MYYGNYQAEMLIYNTTGDKTLLNISQPKPRLSHHSVLSYYCELYSRESKHRKHGSIRWLKHTTNRVALADRKLPYSVLGGNRETSDM